jgi:broad specificity phosphatase PhoE
MIYLVRHGQTEFNRERRLQGHVDSDLTELGVRQAEAVGRLLKDLIPDPAGWRIVSSPLGRTRETSRIVAAATGVADIAYDPRLMEISCGDWDGRLRSEIEAAHPNTFKVPGGIFDLPSGESYEAMSGRLGDWLSSLPPEPERRIIAVSHGVAGRVLRGLYTGLSRGELSTQDVPQDAIFRLQDRRVERIDCEMAG